MESSERESGQFSKFPSQYNKVPSIIKVLSWILTKYVIRAIAEV